MNNDMIVFWKYDAFPYALYGPIIDTDAEAVSVRGYGGYGEPIVIKISRKSILAILPEPMAKRTIDRLEQLEKEKELMDKAYQRLKDAARALFSQTL